MLKKHRGPPTIKFFNKKYTNNLEKEPRVKTPIMACLFIFGLFVIKNQKLPEWINMHTRPGKK